MSACEKYTIGWICAVMTEYVAAQVFLDENHGQPESVSDKDNNIYALGRVGKHNVVIAVLPDGEYGISSAAGVARDMLHSFPNIRIGLMVGIGGGAPSSKHDIRLGDIVVSRRHNGVGGVFQYDFGETTQNQSFRARGFLNQPPTLLRAAVNDLGAQYKMHGHQLEKLIDKALQSYPRLRNEYSRPSLSSDKLYRSNITHPPNKEESCTAVCGDDPSKWVLRPERTEEQDNPAIHYGLIASGNQLMKDALVRDRLAAEKDVLCFEMEAAGLMNHFPCLVIRGICDYSDTHKNKEWQGYGAMAAAAYAKDLLSRIPPNKIEAEIRIAETLADVLDIVSKTEENTREMQITSSRREDLNILEWLTPINYGPHQSDYFNRRQPGTGQWLLSSGKFDAWVNSKKQTLFCPGIPGSGKTFLTSIVIDKLTADFRDDSSISIAYVYCNFRRKHEQKAEYLLASVLKQLAQHKPSLPETVKSLHDKHKDKQTRPSFDEISIALQSVASLYSRVFVVIDALDESPRDCRSRFMSQIFSLQGKCGANIFATSRFIPDITTIFDQSVSMEIRASDDDIRRYLEGHIAEVVPSFVKKNEELQKHIITKISSAVSGVFLLAYIYLGFLHDKPTAKEIKSALEQFQNKSPGMTEDQNLELLASAYDQTMERIHGQGPGWQRLATQVLAWITCAKRPLTALELQHALGVETSRLELDQDNLPQIGDMVSVCAGLVTVDEESGTIRLVHYTTQEYFERTQERWFSTAEDDITAVCVTYLSFNTFGSGMCQTDHEFKGRVQSNPLYDYAARNWGHHARKSSDVSRDVTNFLRCQAKVDASIQALMAVERWPGGPVDSQMVPKRFTGLHLTAFFGVHKAVRFLLQDCGNVDLYDSYGQTPLSWGAKEGSF
ncbi:hypothetical protein B0T25DRAFT_189655 [Lasiosphaeria hispida]|uniref:Nucleoside phosphorylase domain-containing protein n=1 Tax=Lasiosphaeria hispida TaxID=260671 RepID=A0AAJ0MDQ5_9PEZI|nr:hypothetical protein B0T25DRAFT_189655 [Lasiosphaeria hispida]